MFDGFVYVGVEADAEASLLYKCLSKKHYLNYHKQEIYGPINRMEIFSSILSRSQNKQHNQISQIFLGYSHDLKKEWKELDILIPKLIRSTQERGILVIFP
jgi:hypothetical protein